MPVIEITKEQLLASDDWAYVFGEGYGQKPSNLPKRSDVKTIIAAVNGKDNFNDWLGIFELENGLFYYVSAGWADDPTDQFTRKRDIMFSLDELIVYRLSEEEIARLGFYNESLYDER